MKRNVPVEDEYKRVKYMKYHDIIFHIISLPAVKFAYFPTNISTERKPKNQQHHVYLLLSSFDMNVRLTLKFSFTCKYVRDTLVKL